MLFGTPLETSTGRPACTAATRNGSFDATGVNYFLGNGSGLNWSTENDIPATSTRYTVDSALVDGKPALAYLEYSSVDGLEHMFYASASNNNGTSWNAVEDTGVAVDASEFYLIENNGSPAMLLSASEGIFYVYFTP